jgi:2,3-bisphosphoglycerate-independent phosphoglycerate mutase
MRDYPNVLIRTSGEDVGLPAGVMGNSEVGHQNIGAGRIVDQEVMRITRAIRDGSFFENETLQGAIQHVQSTGGKLHLLGLMSDGRVHSDIQHALAIIDMVKQAGLPGERFFLHAITDGRDTSPTGGLEYIQTLQAKLDEAGVGQIATAGCLDNRIGNHGYPWQGFQEFDQHVQNLGITQCAGFYRMNGHVIGQTLELLANQLGVYSFSAQNIMGVLNREAAEQWQRMGSQRRNSLNIGLDAGAAGGIQAGQYQYMGTGITFIDDLASSERFYHRQDNHCQQDKYR